MPVYTVHATCTGTIRETWHVESATSLDDDAMIALIGGHEEIPEGVTLACVNEETSDEEDRTVTAIEELTADEIAHAAPAPPLRLFLYRTPESDDEGDPLDWGAVVAADHTHAVTLITARFTEIGLFGHWCEALDVKVYDSGPVPTVATIPGSGDSTITTITETR